MKTQFRKFHILTPASSRMELMEELQHLGVLHLDIEEPDQNVDISLDDAIHDRNRLQGVIHLLQHGSTQHPVAAEPSEIGTVIDHILELEKQIEHLDQEIDASHNEAERLLPWGDYDFSKFQPLLEKGYHVFLCTCSRKVWKSLDLSDIVHAVVGSYGSNVYFSVVGKESDLDLPVEFFPLPAHSARDHQDIAQEKQKQRNQVYKKIYQYKAYLPFLQQELAAAQDKVFLYEAARTVQWLASGNLIAIHGWVPESRVQSVEEYLDSRKIAYSSRAPVLGENVPVVLKNNKYTRLFEPITKIFELPNYYETDPTPFIAVFYPILFAYCLGDAGYGAILTGGALYGYFTFLKDRKSMALLGIILGVMTTVMGLIKSGSLFGIPLGIPQESGFLGFLGQFVLIPDDSEFIFNAFNVALMIGVVQILSGILISIYNKAHYENNLQAISAVGKLFIVTSLIWIFLSDMQEIAALQVAGYVKYGLLIVGVLLVMFFHQPELSLTKRAMSSVMPLFFIFTGILGDILSFVRLFALGLASSVLGLVVNQIGQQIMSGSVAGIVIGIIFLLFGHTLNFGIAALGSFVHPLRLTFVEFYGNADFEGKGVVYKPLSKSVDTKT